MGGCSPFPTFPPLPHTGFDPSGASHHHHHPRPGWAEVGVWARRN